MMIEARVNIFLWGNGEVRYECSRRLKAKNDSKQDLLNLNELSYVKSIAMYFSIYFLFIGGIFLNSKYFLVFI